MAHEGERQDGNGVRRLRGRQTRVVSVARRCEAGMVRGGVLTYLGVDGEHVRRAVGVVLLAVVVAGKIEAEVRGGAVGRVLLQWAADLKLLVDDLR